MRSFRRRNPDAAPEGLIPAEKLAEAARRTPPPPPAAVADADLVSRRDRLVERFALMQAELGGVYYEMAIRGSVNDDVLLRRAVELQQVDLELAQVERLLSGHDPVAGEPCPACGALTGRADAFCSQCATPLHPAPATNGTPA